MLLLTGGRMALALGMLATGAGAVVPPAAPVFTSNPTITPTSGNVGNLFIGSSGTVTGGDIISQRWLLDGVVISTSTLAVPEAPGSLVYEQTAFGPGGTTVSSSTAATVTAVPLDVRYLNATVGPVATTASATITWNQTVVQGANRKLLVAVALTSNGTITGVTYGGTPLTLAVGNDIRIDGTYYNNISLWYLDNPPVGTAAIVVTRSDTATNRFYGSSTVLFDVTAGAPAVTSTWWTAADGTSYDPTDPVATAADQRLFVLSASRIFSSANSYNEGPGQTSVAFSQGTGSDYVAELSTRKSTAAGALPVSLNVGTEGNASGGRHANFVMAIFQPVPYQAVDPIYYVNAATGNDANDGLTAGTAFKSLTPIQALSPVPRKFELILEDGQYHRIAGAPVIGTPILDLVSAASAAYPPKIRTRLGGKAFIGADIVVTGWSAATSGETNATAVSLGAEKKVMGAGYTMFNFPCIDGAMMQPCVWSPNKYPSSNHDWDDQTRNSDSYAFVNYTNVQDGGTPQAAFDGSKSVQCKSVLISGTDYQWTIRIYDPAFATHYGATSPVGAYICLRSANNQTQMWPISAYSQAESWIETTYVGKSNYGSLSNSASPFFYTILCHPLDLRRAGQYAWSADGQTLYVCWTSGTTKSVAKGDRGVRLRGDYWQVSNVDFARTAGSNSSTATECLLEAGGDYHTYTNIGFRQAIAPLRTPAFGALNDLYPLTNATINGVQAQQVRHHSGIRANNVFNSTINNVVLREIGRTGVYFGGGKATQNGNLGGSNGNVCTNLDLCEHVAVHGNVGTNYQQAYNNSFDKVGFTGCANGITSQVDATIASAVSALGKRITLSRFFGSASRSIGTAVPGAWEVATPIIRTDWEETNSHYDRGLIGPVGSSGISIGNTARPSSSSIYERIATDSLAFDPGAATGCQIKDVTARRTIFGGTGRTGANPWDSYAGATLDAVSDVNVESFNGCISDLAHQRITRNDARTGYQSVQLGPDSWGWVIPAYGAAKTMVDLKITTNWVRNGFQAGKTIGTIVCTMPGSSISLPAGLGNNSLFDIDQGFVFFKAAAVPGTYSLVVRETNAGATNGPTRDTAITITVLAEGANPW